MLINAETRPVSFHLSNPLSLCPFRCLPRTKELPISPAPFSDCPFERLRWEFPSSADLLQIERLLNLSTGMSLKLVLSETMAITLPPQPQTCCCDMSYEVCPEKVQSFLTSQERFVSYGCGPAAKERGRECTCVNNDDLTVLVRGGGGRH